MSRFNNILCGVVPGESNGPTLERAVTLAENNQARLTLVDVIQPVPAAILIPEGGPTHAELQAAIGNARESTLEAMVEPYRKRVQIHTKRLTGVLFLELIREVLRSENDLLIKLAEAPNWLDRLFGSDDMHLLRKCPCPVWLIKPGAPKAARQILVAVDLDDAHPPEELAVRRALNRQILELGCSLAMSDFAKLHVVFVWHPLGESLMRGGLMRTPEAEVKAYLEGLRGDYEQAMNALVKEVSERVGRDALDYLKPQTHLVKGSPGQEIPALASQLEADVVVMGTVGRTGVPGFIMGNTAETILTQIDCSVLAVKPPGFVTPVTPQV